MSHDNERKVLPRSVIDATIKAAVSENQVIRAGFEGFLLAILDTDSDHALERGVQPEQLKQLKMAFFGGAHHLHTTILSAVSEGNDVTDGDIQIMEAVHEELHDYIEEFKAEHGLTELGINDDA